MTQLLTTEEVAGRLGLQVSTIRKLAYQRKLPFVKLGRAVRFREQDIEEFIAKSFRPKIG